jgi:hypothetical protein
MFGDRTEFRTTGREELLYDLKGGSLRSPRPPAAGGRERGVLNW